MICIYRAGGDQDVWGKQLCVSQCDETELQDFEKEGWVNHPYLLDCFDCDDAKAYRDGKKIKKAAKKDEA